MPARKTARKKPANEPPALTTLEAAFCHLLIAERTPEQAAEELGLGPTDATAYMQRRSIATYMKQYRALVMDKMASREALAIGKLKITRESLLLRLYQLSMMPPHETKGNIAGQVEAIREMRDLLGLKFDPKQLPDLLARMTEEELRSMRTPAQPN
jgi:hypothetical protein